MTIHTTVGYGRLALLIVGIGLMGLAGVICMRLEKLKGSLTTGGRKYE